MNARNRLFVEVFKHVVRSPASEPEKDSDADGKVKTFKNPAVAIPLGLSLLIIEEGIQDANTALAEGDQGVLVGFLAIPNTFTSDSHSLLRSKPLTRTTSSLSSPVYFHCCLRQHLLALPFSTLA